VTIEKLVRGNRLPIKAAVKILKQANHQNELTRSLMSKKTVASLLPELSAQLSSAPPHRIGILGSTSFFHYDTEAICAALGQRLAQLPQVALLTGGMPGVAETTARSFQQHFSEQPGKIAPIYHLQPIGFKPWDFGRSLKAGRTLEQRRWLLVQLARVYIVLEGGPVTLQEVTWANQAGAIVIPVACTGGCAAQFYEAINARLDPIADEVDATATEAHARTCPESWKVLNQSQPSKLLVDAIITQIVKALEKPERSPIASIESTSLLTLYRNSPESSILTLNGYDFRGQRLDGFDFRRYCLVNANFEGVSLRGANFEGINITNACFDKAHLEGANFRNAKLQQVQGIEIYAPFADFTGATLHDANLSQGDLYEASFCRVKAIGICLDEAELEGVDARESIWEQATLTKTNAFRADFSNSCWQSSLWEQVNLWGANLLGANLEGCQVQNTNLQQASSDRPCQKPVILIVDDSITVRELVAMSLKKLSYQVQIEQARDGKEAWEKLRAGLHCDLIFCDIEMPVMDGYELLKRLKQDCKFSSIPVVLMISRGVSRMGPPLTSQTLGAEDLIRKPYTEEKLLEIADYLLQNSLPDGLKEQAMTNFATQRASETNFLSQSPPTRFFAFDLNQSQRQGLVAILQPYPQFLCHFWPEAFPHDYLADDFDLITALKIRLQPNPNLPADFFPPTQNSSHCLFLPDRAFQIPNPDRAAHFRMPQRICLLISALSAHLGSLDASLRSLQALKIELNLRMLSQHIILVANDDEYDENSGALQGLKNLGVQGYLPSPTPLNYNLAARTIAAVLRGETPIDGNILEAHLREVAIRLKRDKFQ